MTMELEGLNLQKRATADRDVWPLLPAERNWTQWQLFVVMVVSAIATWCYIIGEYVGYYLNLRMGFTALTAGSMIGMLIVTVAVVPAATQFGIESIATSKTFLGNRGWMLAVFLQYVSIIGWNSLLLIFFSKSTVRLLATMQILPQSTQSFIVPVLTTMACIAVYVALRRGTTGVKSVSKALFLLIVGVGLWMMFILLTQQGNALTTAKPHSASSDLLWNYTTGIEIGIVSLVAWWPYIGAMVRVSPNAHSATLPVMLGMGLPVPLLSMVGLAAFLVIGNSDPSAWLVSLGGPIFGAIALLFVIAANFGTAVTGVYVSAVGLRHLPFFSSLSWQLTVAIALLPVGGVGIAIPEFFFNGFGSFLAFLGVIFAPLCGIQIVDYYFLRRQCLNLRGIYDSRQQSAYYFSGGFNLAALLALLAGFVCYIYLLNPISYASHLPYQFLTASLPTCAISGLVYWLVTRWFNIPRGLGDYSKFESPLGKLSNLA